MLTITAGTIPLLGEAVSEDEMALALDTAMRRLGAEDRAFETIVASGPNAAKPHARPTKRVIGVGDPVVVDFGAIFEGYRSDMTRTFCNDAVERIEAHAKNTLAAMAEGDELRTLLAALRRFNAPPF